MTSTAQHIRDEMAVAIREPTQKLKAIVKLMEQHNSKTRHNCNMFHKIIRLFTVPEGTAIGFVTDQILRQYGALIQSCYIFKVSIPAIDEPHTHGLHLSINGFARRGDIDKLVKEFVSILVGTEGTRLIAVLPNLKGGESVFDYIKKLYVLPSNVLVSFSHQLDLLSQNAQDFKLDHKKVQNTMNKIHSKTQSILDGIMGMPGNYPHSHLYTILNKDISQFKRYMKQTTLSDVTTRIIQDAYDLAIQNKCFTRQDVQELLQPMSRMSQILRYSTDSTTKQVQKLLEAKFRVPYVHPHPYIDLVKGQSNELKVFDGLKFDPKFLFSFLLVARWFARVCMREDKYISNNKAQLLLCGLPGTGKTFIVNVIASCIPTYKYLTKSRFQNPDLLQSSLMLIEEFSTIDLPTNEFKQILDLKSHVKIDFKNLHPANATEGVPCMITTNDDVIGILKSQKRHSAESVDAAIRRLDIVPMKMQKFDKLHGEIPPEHKKKPELGKYDRLFEQSSNKQRDIFNLIFSFGLFQQNLEGFYLDENIHSYIKTSAAGFKDTLFGVFYLTNKTKVDELLVRVEQFTTKDDINGTEYNEEVTGCAGQFQQLITQFLEEMSRGIEDINPLNIRDFTLPWPVKYFYLMDNKRFVVKKMWQLADFSYKAFINQEVASFINNTDMCLYRIASTQDETLAFNEEYMNDARSPSIQSVHEPDNAFNEQQGVSGLINTTAYNKTVVDQQKHEETYIDVDSVLKKRYSNEQSSDEDYNETSFYSSKRPKFYELSDFV